MAFEIVDGVLVKYHSEENEKTVVVPDGVREIGKKAFFECCTINEIYLPNGLLLIGEYAFALCKKLTVIHIPKTVAEIEHSAFTCTKLERVVLPKGLTSIAGRLFSGCSELKSVDIPDTVISIETNAFSSCFKLHDIKLPSGLKYIGNDAFYFCSNLEELSFPESVVNISSGAFKVCSSVRELKLPNALTEIDEEAFEFCSNLSSISFGNYVQKIGAQAFLMCKALTSIYLPDSINEIGESAFELCPNIAILHMPGGRKEITSKSFKNSSALSKDSLKKAQDSETFAALFNLLNAREKREWAKDWMRDSTSCPEVSQERLSSYVVKEKTNIVKAIIKEQDTDLLKAAMSMRLIDGKNIDDIQPFALDTQNAELLSMLSEYIAENSSKSDWGKKIDRNANISPDSVTALKKNWKWVVNDDNETCTITEYRGEDPDVIVPQTIGGKAVTAIGDGAFSSKHVWFNKRKQWLEESLKSVVLPEGIITIGEEAFFKCATLQHVVLPNTLQSIGKDGFSNCDSLKKIVLPESLLSIGDSGFYLCKSLENIEFPESLLSIGDSGFACCGKLTRIVMPSSLANLGHGAFCNCDALVEVSINETLSEIPGWCFEHCEKLDNVDLPLNIKSIGSNAFGGCLSLKHLYLSKYVERISSACFRNMVVSSGYDNYKDSPTQVEIDTDNPVYTVKDNMLLSKDLKKLIDYLPGCVGDIRIPSTVEEMPKRIFYEYRMITSVYIPGSVKEIPRAAFGWCQYLSEVHIEEGVERIEERAFYRCSRLSLVDMPASISYIANDAFEPSALKKIGRAPEGSYAAKCIGLNTTSPEFIRQKELLDAISKATEGMPKEEQRIAKGKAVLDDWIHGGEWIIPDLIINTRHVDKLSDEEVQGIAARMLAMEQESLISWNQCSPVITGFLLKCYRHEPMDAYIDVFRHFRENALRLVPMFPYDLQAREVLRLLSDVEMD